MLKKESIKKILIQLFGQKIGLNTFNDLIPLLNNFSQINKIKKKLFTHEDIVLITYGDSLIKNNEKPLKSIERFCINYLSRIFNTIHILPFFPYSSDDGFSVIDYYKVDPKLGSWRDIKNLSKNFNIMYDFVLNHISSRSEWFKNFLAHKKGFNAFAIESNKEADLQKVVRPRDLPLLSIYRKDNNKKVFIWTTFSRDQIDINYSDSDTIIRMIKVLLFYLEKGAKIIRLDAIAYLWKKEGTSCIHLKEVHLFVKLLRNIIDYINSDALLLTETNVPHRENTSYFGQGNDEAHMVYNFTLPPLLLYSFIVQNIKVFSKWAKGIHSSSKNTTFFNFTASHDGIGVRPLEGILSKKEISLVLKRVKKNGGKISYKKNSDGSRSPYELNITYVDALINKKNKNPLDHAKRFIASQSIALVLPGVPAVYIHSLLGSHNYIKGINKNSPNRIINREKLKLDTIERELKDKSSFRNMVFYPYCHMIKIRKTQTAFLPDASFKIYDIYSRVFCIIRGNGKERVLALTNISSNIECISLKKLQFSLICIDLLSDKEFTNDIVEIGPYSVLWLKGKSKPIS